jgi:hypothetical protein
VSETGTIYTVTLSPDEIHAGATHGILRRFMKHNGMRSERSQKMASSWDNEIEGALAELAWCKMRGRFWSGMSGLKHVDAGKVEIRWTRHENGGLIFYPDRDKDTSTFILARGFAPTYEFVGYMTGAEARQLGRPTDFGLLVDAGRLHNLPSNLTREGTIP